MIFLVSFLRIVHTSQNRLPIRIPAGEMIYRHHHG